MRPLPPAAKAAAPVDDLAGLFRGFADPTRLRILNLLAAGELCVCDLVEILELRQPTVSRHLAYLRRTRLVEARPELRFTYYRLAEPRDAVHGNLIDCVRTCFRDIRALARDRKAAEARVAARMANPCR